MNDREISDFDKLKNLFIEFGLETEICKMGSGLQCILLIGVGYKSCDFVFDDKGKFQKVYID